VSGPRSRCAERGRRGALARLAARGVAAAGRGALGGAGAGAYAPLALPRRARERQSLREERRERVWECGCAVSCRVVLCAGLVLVWGLCVLGRLPTCAGVIVWWV
jgi:hypothetical protein